MAARMFGRPGWMAALVLAGAFAGCVDNGAGTGTANSPAARPAPSGSEAVLVGEGGAIAGTVTDIEFTPLANASAILDEEAMVVDTNDAGRFLFEGVPAGSHTVTVTKTGYESQAKGVEVAFGEIAKTSFALLQLAPLVPYHDVYPHVALHHFGAGIYLSWQFGLQNISAACESCHWRVNAATAPSYLVWELEGRHTVPAVAMPASEAWWMFRDGEGEAATAIYECGGTGQSSEECRLPYFKTIMDDTMIGKTKDFRQQIMCDYYWMCIEERRNVWITLFHNTEELDPEYTARPP